MKYIQGCDKEIEHEMVMKKCVPLFLPKQISYRGLISHGLLSLFK